MTFQQISVKVAFKMDALKLYGKRFLVDVLSQLESYNVRYNQFDNTTFRLDWFLGVLDRFSPTNLGENLSKTPIHTNNRIDENFNHNYCTRDQDHASHLNQNPNLNQESSALNPACNKGLILSNVIYQVPKINEYL